jgi:virulence-associated protein VapD
MRNWENDLSPIARERLARIGQLTPEEEEKMLDSEKVNSLLSEFYQGQIDPERLWKKLKEEGKPSLLREAQVRLVDSLSFGSTPAELQRKRDGILAIETLKKEQNTSTIELNLKRMEDLQKRYRAEIEQVYKDIRAEVERNPQLRVKQVQQGQNTMVIQLTVDEAIKQLPQWQDFLSNQEKSYSQEFARVIEKLKRELK